MRKERKKRVFGRELVVDYQRTKTKRKVLDELKIEFEKEKKAISFDLIRQSIGR